MIQLKLEVESKVKKEKLNRDTNTKAAIEVMRESFEYQDDAEVGIFWYDITAYESKFDSCYLHQYI